MVLITIVEKCPCQLVADISAALPESAIRSADLSTRSPNVTDSFLFSSPRQILDHPPRKPIDLLLRRSIPASSRPSEIQYEEFAKGFLFQPAGRKCYQQNLCQVHEEWKGAKDRSGTLPEAGHSMLIQAVFDMPINRAGRRKWKQ